MGKISTADARGLYTKTIVAAYANRRRPSSFFTKMFTKSISDTLELSVEVQRGTQLIAVDVSRGTEGNRNTFNFSTEKIFEPPYFKEFFNITEIDLYDRLYLDKEVDSKVLSVFVRTAVQKLAILQDKIDRAIEKQCADVLQTGVVQMKNGNWINYGRKAASLLNPGSGSYYTDATDPFEFFAEDCQFIRDNGLVSDTTFNAVMGTQAMHDLLNNTAFKARQGFFNMKLDNVIPPQFVDVVGGAVYQGQISAGNYRVNLWTYPDTYKDPTTGVITPYMNSKKYVLMPMNTEYTIGYAANPQLITDPTPGIAIQKGEYVIYDFVDPRALSHTYNIQSSPLAIPVAIDTTVTRTVCA